MFQLCFVVTVLRVGLFRIRILGIEINNRVGVWDPPDHVGGRERGTEGGTDGRTEGRRDRRGLCALTI